jgi:DNA polymerase
VTLRLDKETVSAVDLRRTGVYRYAQDKTTDVILACYADPGAQRVDTWRPGMKCPDRIVSAVETGETITAWNAQFEREMWYGVMTPRYGWPRPEPEQFDCTMARAMYWGYPGSLEGTGAAMGLSTVKDKAGHALMLRMCRPRSIDAAGNITWWHQTDPAKYDELDAYCQQDTRAEDAIAVKLPPLPDTERKLWLLDQKMNMRGMPVDMDLVEDMERIVGQAERISRSACPS